MPAYRQWYRYVWHNDPWHVPGVPERRIMLHGRRCRVLARGTMNSALVEFEDGQREVISRNALRRADCGHFTSYWCTEHTTDDGTWEVRYCKRCRYAVERRRPVPKPQQPPRPRLSICR